MSDACERINVALRTAGALSPTTRPKRREGGLT